MRAARGFTLVELMAVVFILGVIALAMIPALDNMVPSYRLRSGAREVGSMIELAQSEAIANRKEFAIAYDLDEHTYWLVLPQLPEQERPAPQPAAPEEGEAGKPGQRPVDDVEHGRPPPDPNAPPDQEAAAERLPGFTERDALSPEHLPDGVIFDRVIVGDDEKTTGRVYVPFSHLGQSGAHVVGFRLKDQEANEAVWVKFSPLSRTIDLTSEKPEVKKLESETGSGATPAAPPMPAGGG